MQLISSQLNLDFLGPRKYAWILSAVLILVSIASLWFRGLSLGVDFTGGTLVEVGYPQAVELQQVRGALEVGGFEDALVQHFGTAKDVLVRLPSNEDESSANLSNRVLQALASTGDPEMRRVEFVGPQVGEELRDDGGLAVIYALFGILIYVGLRFEYRFSFGAVAALIHDVVLVLGFFSLVQAEFDLTVLAAVLAVIGYSLNDTIVLFDRVRENFRKLRKKTPEEIINVSVNQTLSRTLMTSITTLMVLFALFVFGGEVIHAFSLALIVGVIIGTYSSIYIASSSLLLLNVSVADLLPVEKEDGEANSMP